MTYGSKIWVVRSVEKSIQRRVKKRMLQMMCGVQLADGVSLKKLMARLVLNNMIIKVVRQESLKWLEHVVKRVMIVLNRCEGLRFKALKKGENLN